MRKRQAVCPDEAGYGEIAALVAERSGMVFAPNRRVEVEAGIARAMEHAGMEDCAAYLLLVRSDGIAWDQLVDELTVGETHFMRDPDQMDLLRLEVLPEIRRRRGRGARVRAWSAGCASGEEAYTLAILLEEGGQDGSRTNLTLGLHAGHFLTPRLSLGGELRLQRWMTNAAPVRANPQARETVTAAFGPRFHLKWGKRWVRPGVSYPQALDRPLDTQRYRMLQIDVRVVF